MPPAQLTSFLVTEPCGNYRNHYAPATATSQPSVPPYSSINPQNQNPTQPYIYVRSYTHTSLDSIDTHTVHWYTHNYTQLTHTHARYTTPTHSVISHTRTLWFIHTHPSSTISSIRTKGRGKSNSQQEITKDSFESKHNNELPKLWP